MSSSKNQSGIDSSPVETAREMLDIDMFDDEISHQVLEKEFEPLIMDKMDEKVDENSDPNRSTPNIIRSNRSLTRIRITFEEEKFTAVENQSPDMSSALSDIELGIDNQYWIKMQEMQEKRRLVLQQKEKRRKEMAEQRYLSAALNARPEWRPEMRAAKTRKRNRFTPYPSKPAVLSYDRDDDNDTVVRIENISHITTESSISTLCQTIGPVFDCAIQLSSDGQRTGVVHFLSSEDAKEFCRTYHLYCLDSKRIRPKIV